MILLRTGVSPGADRHLFDTTSSAGPAIAALRRRRARDYLMDLRPSRPQGLVELRQRLAVLKPDILHTRLEASNHLGTLVALSLGATRPKIVLQTDNDPAEQYSWWHQCLGRIVNNRIDAHLAISPSVAEAAHRLYGCTSCPRVTIPIGIDCNRWRAAQPARIALVRSALPAGWCTRRHWTSCCVRLPISRADIQMFISY